MKLSDSGSDLQQRLKAANEIWESGDPFAAHAAYAAILAQSPRLPVALCRLGDLALRVGALDQAERYFAAAIEADVGFVWGHFGRARVCERLGRRREAIAFCRAALALEPEQQAFIELLRTLERPRQAPAMADANALRLLQYRLADELLNAGKVRDAAALLTEMRATDGDSPALLCKLGNALTQDGQPDAALECFARAQALDQNFVWTFVGRAEAEKALARFSEAMADLDRACRIAPESAPIRVRRDALQTLIRQQAEDEDGPPLLHWPANAPGADAMPLAPRIQVIAWDLGHNPVGRAALLAEIAARVGRAELAGPLFQRYGDELWPPLAQSTRPTPIHGFRPAHFASFVNGALRLVRAHPCDIAWVSKPRFPSLFIGLLQKLLHGARLVIDIDDDELAFVDAAGPLDLGAFIETATAADWDAPYGRRWTQLAVGLIAQADHITSCNPLLQARHGGTLVRHARDELAFQRAAGRRDAVRARLGIRPSDQLVLFLGTPRRHKGVLELAAALEAAHDPRLLFCVIGSIVDPQLEKSLRACGNLRLMMLPDQPLDQVAEFNAIADLVCLIQDPQSPVAAVQTPAKLTDALASGTPVVATSVPPIADLVEPGRIVTVPHGKDVAILAAAIRRALAQNDTAQEEARRAFFREALSIRAHAARLEGVFGDLCARPPRPLADLTSLFVHLRETMPGDLSPAWLAHRPHLEGWRPKVGPLRRLDRGINLVFFWKQNDTGLYGRRHDMLLRQFERMPGIRRILQIDAPIAIDEVQRLLMTARANPLNGMAHVVGGTVQRFLRTRDEGKIFRRSFIHAGSVLECFGQPLPPLSAFPREVERWITELDMRDNALAWVCPVVPGFPEVQEHVGFSFIVSDVIDDQREWPMRPERRQALQRNYDRTFAVTDAAFANCEAVADWLRGEGLPTRMVPNGADDFPDLSDWEPPETLTHLPRPIVGYAGNLGDRIDWELIAAIADGRPDWSIVLIGALPRTAQSEAVLARGNVTAFGVVPYAQAVRHIAAFDAAMIPHRDNSLSERMNPLKLYVYRALGVPVVSTPIANIDDLADDIALADDAAAFLAALDAACRARAAHGRVMPDPSRLEALFWPQRMREIMAHVTETFLRTQGRGRSAAMR